MISLFKKKRQQYIIDLFISSHEGAFLYCGESYLLAIPRYTEVTNDKSTNSIHLNFSKVYDKYGQMSSLEKEKLYMFIEALYQLDLGQSDYKEYFWLKNASNLTYNDSGILDKVLKDFSEKKEGISTFIVE